jgi:fibronectin type 3 domain-containing protein
MFGHRFVRLNECVAPACGSRCIDRRRPARAGKALAIALVTALAVAPRAAAMPSEVADATWGVNGRVSAITQVGDVVVMGGSFTAVRENGGAGPAELARSNIAAFDASTGAPLEGWAPQVNGAVYALALSPDRRWIYAGGAFTAVDGITRYRLVALDAATGAVVKTWKPASVFSSVRALAVAGNRVYLGGLFQTLGGQERLRLGALDAGTGALDTAWAPSADGTVKSLAVSPDGARVYAAGEFDAVSGLERRRVVALEATGAGAVISDWNPNPGKTTFSLAVTADTVYGAVGGSANMLAAWDAATGVTRWTRHSDGDFQAVAVAGNMVYGGGHFNYVEGELRRKLVAVDGVTGQIRKSWKPILPHDTVTWEGVWALSTEGDSRLAVGGDFTTVSGVTQQRFAQFTGSIGGASGDTTPPTMPTNVSATAVGGERIELEWSASTDDDAVSAYRIIRDGQQIDTSATAGYVDRTVQPDTTYAYQIVASDFAGHDSESSATAVATTAPPDETVTFTAVEDAQLDADTPDTNAGTNRSLRADASPKRDFIVKFDLSGLAGRQVLGAKLRLRCIDAGTNGGEFSRVPDNSWSESTVTWNTAPATDGTVADAINDVAVGEDYDLDVTPLVTGDGQLSVRVRTTSANSVGYMSSEGDVAPRLIVTLADPTASPPRPKVFTDGFETADLSRWSEATGMAVGAEEPFAGTWATSAQPNGQPGYALKRLRRGHDELYTRLRFKVQATPPESVVLLRYRTGTGGPLVRLFMTGTRKLGVRNDITGASVTSTAGVPEGAWQTLQLRARVDGDASRVEVSLNGARVDALTRTDSLGTTPIGRIQLGDDGTGKLYDLAFDAFEADSVPVADLIAPSAPTGLHATAVGEQRVDLAWTAATDDTAVTGYRVYRDGELVTTVGTVTNAPDPTVAPGTSYTYDVRAVDAAGNESPPSEPVEVTTPEPDTASPSTPATSATAISFDRVDVAWSASSDDRGVTGYRVYRDGELLTTTGGGTTRYRDVTVRPATAYAYAVEAFDAAGNVSDRSEVVSASTYQSTVFRDGFESGDLSQWTTVRNIVAQQTEAFAGTWSARANAGGVATYAYRQLGADYADLTTRLRFKLVSLGSGSMSMLKLRTATGGSLVRLFIGSTGKLSTRNDVTGVATTSSTTISTDRWYLAELRVKVDGATSVIEVWLDGTRIAALSSSSQSLGTTPIGRIQLGDDATSKTADFAFDELVVDVPPSGGTPAISGTAVAGETLTADPGSWSGTQPVTFAYQWRRCDTTGGSCADVADATEATYVLSEADEDATIRVAVTASNAAGSQTASSDATEPVVVNRPPYGGTPVITGIPALAETLTADPGSWSGTEPISFAYQWRRCDASGGSCEDIPGATDVTYVPTADDAGSTIRVAVRASNAHGEQTATSEPTQPVTAP